MIKGHFLKAPETQIGVRTMTTIHEWDDSPTALQILKSIDSAIFGADCSMFVVRTLEVYLDKAIEAEQTTYEDVAKLAIWRTM